MLFRNIVSIYREKLEIVAEGATAPETLRQKGPVSTVHSGERP